MVGSCCSYHIYIFTKSSHSPHKKKTSNRIHHFSVSAFFSLWLYVWRKWLCIALMQNHSTERWLFSFPISPSSPSASALYPPYMSVAERLSHCFACLFFLIYIMICLANLFEKFFKRFICRWTRNSRNEPRLDCPMNASNCAADGLGYLGAGRYWGALHRVLPEW